MKMNKKLFLFAVFCGMQALATVRPAYVVSIKNETNQPANVTVFFTDGKKQFTVNAGKKGTVNSMSSRLTQPGVMVHGARGQLINYMPGQPGRSLHLKIIEMKDGNLVMQPYERSRSKRK